MMQLLLKKRIMLLCFPLFLVNQTCEISNKTQEETSYKELVSLFTVNPLRIDGQLDEGEWKYAKSLSLKDDSLRSDNTVLIRTLWDEQNLYMGFQVKDKNLQSIQTTRDHSELFLDDMVEFLIDARNEKDSCWTTDDVVYHVNLLGQKKDDRGTMDCRSDTGWNGDAKIAVQLTGTLNDSTDADTGYDLEVAISWEELNVNPFHGFQMGINFANGDGGILFDWAGAWPFRSPDDFGNLVLKKNEREKNCVSSSTAIINMN